jgi:arylformamidase
MFALANHAYKPDCEECCMPIIDISRELNPRIAVWPGDTPFQLTSNLRREDGAAVNLTSLTLSAHTGSHVDAPRHFSDDPTGMAELDLRPYWGPAQVVTVDKPDGPLYPADLAHVDLRGVKRLLIHSAASHLDPALFPEQFVYPSPELADFLGQLGIVLWGTDAPSVDHVNSKTLDGHTALLRNGIAILEGLWLADVADGRYELVALPLKISGGDGSPVRAVLRT